MNDSLIFWTAVAVLVLVAVILYCLWRLLTRRPSQPVPGGATDPEISESVRVGHIPSVTTVDEIGGPEFKAARGRARAAAVQRAEQRESVAADAAALGSGVGAAGATPEEFEWVAGPSARDDAPGVGISPVGATADDTIDTSTDAGPSVGAYAAPAPGALATADWIGIAAGTDAEASIASLSAVDVPDYTHTDDNRR